MRLLDAGTGEDIKDLGNNNKNNNNNNNNNYNNYNYNNYNNNNNKIIITIMCLLDIGAGEDIGILH